VARIVVHDACVLYSAPLRDLLIADERARRAVESGMPVPGIMRAVLGGLVR
jgi:hypothetical protein